MISFFFFFFPVPKREERTSPSSLGVNKSIARLPSIRWLYGVADHKYPDYLLTFICCIPQSPVRRNLLLTDRFNQRGTACVCHLTIAECVLSSALYPIDHFHSVREKKKKTNNFLVVWAAAFSQKMMEVLRGSGWSADRQSRLLFFFCNISPFQKWAAIFGIWREEILRLKLSLVLQMSGPSVHIFFSY